MSMIYVLNQNIPLLYSSSPLQSVRWLWSWQPCPSSLPVLLSSCPLIQLADPRPRQRHVSSKRTRGYKKKDKWHQEGNCVNLILVSHECQLILVSIDKTSARKLTDSLSLQKFFFIYRLISSLVQWNWLRLHITTQQKQHTLVQSIWIHGKRGGTWQSYWNMPQTVICPSHDVRCRVCHWTSILSRPTKRQFIKMCVWKEKMPLPIIFNMQPVLAMKPIFELCYASYHAGVFFVNLGHL